LRLAKGIYEWDKLHSTHLKRARDFEAVDSADKGHL